MQMKRRRFRLRIGASARPLARLTSESDDIAVPTVPKRDTRKPGQCVALAAHVIRLARHT
jgi:hypothetical protein